MKRWVCARCAENCYSCSDTQSCPFCGGNLLSISAMKHDSELFAEAITLRVSPAIKLYKEVLGIEHMNGDDVAEFLKLVGNIANFSEGNMTIREYSKAVRTVCDIAERH